VISIFSNAREHWIYKNQEALDSLMRGMADAKDGRVVEMDIDFSKYLDEEGKRHAQI
jgi:predicted transcriptional regulator